MEAEKYTYLYPIYFDAEKTSSEGRRLPSSLCKKNPLANDILLAAQSCGLTAELEQHKSHPRSLIDTGRVKVVKSVSKNQLIMKIASILPSIFKSSNNNNNITNNNNNNNSSNPSKPNSSSTSVEIAPNLVYQVRSKKNKKNK